MLLRMVFAFALCASAFASLVRIDVLGRRDLPHGYQRIAAKAYFEVDPNLPANRIVRDIELAPRNQRGMVEFSADLTILKPRDTKRANGTVLVEIPNRGGEGMVRTFDFGSGADDAQLGDGFLLDRGFLIVSVGWQFDVPGGLRLYAPAARGVTGLVRSEFTTDTRTTRFSLGDRNMIPYPVSDASDPRVVLAVRESVEGPRIPIPRDRWRFEGAEAVMESGFEPGRIYDAIYPSKDPAVAGLGMAAVRDVVSAVKYGGAGERATRAIGFGVSQCGRFLRQFVYDGFNEDEKGRIVFDGIMAHVAGGGRGSFNQRFAQPSRDGHPFMNTFYPVDVFPFTDLPETDPETKLTDGLLVRAAKAGAVPKIFYTNSSYEYYGRAGSLIHTTLDGRADAPLARTTRVYLFAGGQHGPAAFPPKPVAARNLPNPNDFYWSLRALLVAMQNWLAEGKEPPASQYPRIDAGTLAPLDRLRLPKIPGIELPTRIHKAYRVEYGSEPPKVGAAFAMLVPQVDEDGNEIAGIRMPEIQVPLATYTGWNLRTPEIGAPEELFSMAGSWIPVARTAEQRKGDPRRSIAERYPTRAAYLERIVASARALAASGYLLEADIPALVNRAGAMWDSIAAR